MDRLISIFNLQCPELLLLQERQCFLFTLITDIPSHMACAPLPLPQWKKIMYFENVAWSVSSLPREQQHTFQLLLSSTEPFMWGNNCFQLQESKIIILIRIFFKYEENPFSDQFIYFVFYHVKQEWNIVQLLVVVLCCDREIKCFITI